MKNGTKLSALLLAALMLLPPAAFGETAADTASDEAAEAAVETAAEESADGEASQEAAAAGEIIAEEAPAGEATAEEPAPLEPEQLIMTINGRMFLKADFDQAVQLLEANEYASDYVSAYYYLLQNGLFEYGFDKYGLNSFTDEEKAAFHAEAEATIEDFKQSYIDYYKTTPEPSEEELAELASQAQAYLDSYGYTVETLENSIASNASYEKMEAYVKENYQLAVTDEEADAAFAYKVESDKEMYEGQVSMYEFYTQYYGAESYYIPDGYRGVLQILLKVDDALLEDYTSKQAAYEEQMNAEEAEADETAQSGEAAGTEEAQAEQPAPVTAEEVEEARLAVIASVQSVIDEINTRLANGESFVDLIPEYNIDPGMQNESNLKTGYLVHKDSILYDPAFISAAFSGNMNQVGDVSEPSVGSYGIYIVYYLRDAGGAVELTDDLKAQLITELEAEKVNTKYGELLTEWQNECEIVYEEEPFTQLTGISFTDGKPAAVTE